MRRLRLNRAPSFQCRDVYQECTPTHLHWIRTVMIRSWQPQDAKAISIEFPTSILLLRSMQNLSPSYREADAMMIAGHGWKRVANTLLKITLPLAAAIGAPLIAGSAAIAQTYPSQPIKVICPMSSGSPIDVTARVVTNDLSNRLGKPVIVENRRGGGGTIGVGEFTRAAPDGHTLLCGAIGDAFASKVIGRDPAKDFNFGTLSNLLPLIREGKVRALAVTSKARSPDLADVPTMAQSGFPQLTRGDWIGFWAPAGTSPDIVNRLNREINAGLTTPETKAAMKKLGFEPSVGSPQEFAAFIRDEIEAWTPAAKAADILPK